MTFNPAAAISVNKLCDVIVEPKTVIEFGNQRYTAKDYFPADSTKDFYEKRGFVYKAIDVNEDKHSFIGDLNEPLDIKEKFSLVTNIGTSEHIFNQAQIFKTAHDLCDIKGFMYHQLPFSPWINHGFFNYNPILFRDIAVANGYVLGNINLSDRWGQFYELDPVDMFLEKRPYMLEDIVKGSGKNLFVNVIFRKLKDEPFRMPFQGKYVKDIKDKKLNEKYGKRP